MFLQTNLLPPGAAPKNGHGQDNIAVLAPDVQIAQHVVGNSPNKVRDPIQIAVHDPTPFIPL
jgi:hypothetical protein